MNNLTFIIGLMRQGYNSEPNSIGFIPDSQVRDYYLRNGLYVIQHDLRGRPVGYILHGNPKGGNVLRIAQAIIDVDRRNLGFGLLAVNEVIARAKIANCRQIALSCAADLDSNGFWRQAGYEHVHTRYPKNKRKRAINRYLMDLWPTLWG